MDRLVFEVRHNNVYSKCELIKDLINISCRLRIDFEKNIIIAENIKDEDVNDLYNLISRHFTILSIDLINSDNDSDVIGQTNTSSEQNQENITSQSDQSINPCRQDQDDDSLMQECQDFGESKVTRKPRKHVSGNQEKVLSRYIKPELDKIDLNSDPKDQALKFLENINMPREDMIVSAFVIAYSNSQITYSYLTNELSKIYPNLAPTTCNAYFQNIMKNWVESNHPEIMKECKIVSFITLVRMYARKFT